MNHIVALSGGKDSCAVAFKLKELHPEYDPYYVCTPTGSELPEMKEHWAKLECMLGKPCTFRNEHKDKWATSLADLRAEFVSGKIPKNYRGIPANQTSFDMEDERDGMCSFCAR